MAGNRVSALVFSLLAPVGTYAQGACRAKTSAETLQGYRNDLDCPAAAPTGCECAPYAGETHDCPSSAETLWESDGLQCVYVTPDVDDTWAKHTWSYPATYAATCEDTGAGKEPASFHCTRVADDAMTATCGETMYKEHMFQKDHDGYNAAADSQAWCSNKFCWVDPCSCNKEDQVISSWLASYYSYSQCGAEDVYTPVSCDATTQGACDSQSQCMWDAELVGDAPPSDGMTCMPKTSEEIIQDYRNVLQCPDAAPTGCECKPFAGETHDCPSSAETLWESDGKQCVYVTPDVDGTWAKHTWSYPATYAATCADTGAGKEPGSFHCTRVDDAAKTATCGKTVYKEHMFQKDHDGYNAAADSQAWCLTNFCWVDPCSCDKKDMVKSSWLDSFYSYSQCGAEDVYTPVSCDATNQGGCESQAQCKWAPAPEMCGNIPCDPVPSNPSMKCGDIKKAYKDQACCGNPEKMFDLDNGRRLAADPRLLAGASAADDILGRVQKALQKAHKEGGQAKAAKLAASIQGTLRLSKLTMK